MKKRNIFNKLLEQQNTSKISILLGPRQVGKTTLLKMLYTELKKNNNALFLDLDIYSNYEKISSLGMFVNTAKLSGYNEQQTGFFYIFLDEFQRYADLTKILKNVYDHYPNIKIYASGSASLTIKDRIQESLSGRKLITQVYPLDFREFLTFKENDSLLRQIENLDSVHSDVLHLLSPELYAELEEFLIYGGYPEVVLANNGNQKKEYLTSILDLYIRKDLIDYLRIEKIRSVKDIVQYLAVNHGQEINYATLAQIAAIDVKTVKNYLEILKETYITLMLTPFFHNKTKEIVKSPKIYFLDNGVRNFFINNFNPAKIRNDASFLFEEFVITELTKSGIPPSTIKFWRTKNGHEVDIIIDNVSQILPIEVKYKTSLQSSDFRGLNEFGLSYPQITRRVLVNTGSNISPQKSLKLKNIKLCHPFNLGSEIAKELERQSQSSL